GFGSGSMPGSSWPLRSSRSFQWRLPGDNGTIARPGRGIQLDGTGPNNSAVSSINTPVPVLRRFGPLEAFAQVHERRSGFGMGTGLIKGGLPLRLECLGGMEEH